MRKSTRRTLTGRFGDLQNKMNVTLMMILLAFFIVLNTMAVSSDQNTKAALGSLTGTLGILPGGPSPFYSEAKNLSKPSAPMIAPSLTVASLLGEFEDYAMQADISKKITSLVTNNGLELTITSSLLFKPGVAAMRPAGETILDKVGVVLRKLKGPFVIEGHTDNRKIRSARYRDSTVLSTAQAGVVLRYFRDNTKISKSKLGLSGYGPKFPMFANDTVAHRERNNRIKIIYKRAI